MDEKNEQFIKGYEKALRKAVDLTEDLGRFGITKLVEELKKEIEKCVIQGR